MLAHDGKSALRHRKSDPDPKAAWLDGGASPYLPQLPGTGKCLLSHPRGAPGPALSDFVLGSGIGYGVAMTTLRWLWRMVRDIVWLGRANRSPFLSLGLLLLLAAGLLTVAAKVSAPYIYTLF